MKYTGTSQNYQKGNLKAMIHFAEYIGEATSFFDIGHKHVLRFLDTKIKPEQIDPDKKWITTWNDYLWRLKLFFRWLHNKKIKEIDGEEQEVKPEDEWKTPSFLQQIKKKKTKRLSPYLETEIWDRDELLTVVKYEPYIRNKAALTLFWDLDARNHEVTMLQIKHIRLREKYGEGEVPSTTPPMAIVYSSRVIRISNMFKTGMTSDLIRLELLILIGPVLIDLFF